MRNTTRLAAVVLLVFGPGTGACRKYTTQPIYRRPVISSVVAFPTTLGPGDSTMITVTASDPNGDSLVYDWEAYNGLITRGTRENFLFSTRSPSRVFIRSMPSPSPIDTAFVICSVRDQKGGGDSREVLIFYSV